MFKNFLVTAFRNFKRNRLFSIINILGLSIGISAAMVIYMIVHYEFSFDHFETKRESIFRVITGMKFSTTQIKMPGAATALADAARKGITGLDYVCGFEQFMGSGNLSIPNPDEVKPRIFKNQPNIIFTDSNYFTMVPYRWLAGSRTTSLNGPHKVVLTEQRARANPVDSLRTE